MYILLFIALKIGDSRSIARECVHTFLDMDKILFADLQDDVIGSPP